MRIIAGKNKGSILHLPEGKITRPLKDRVRESIFNLLTHSNKISFKFKGSNVLDLYSGTGSFGLECLSRESSKICFIEKKKESKKILEQNIKKLKAEKNSYVFFDDVFNIIIKKNIFEFQFELIFCDPPFKDSNIIKLIDQIHKKNILKKDGIFVLHRNINTKEKFPEYFKTIEEKKYGKSKIILGSFLF